MKALRTDPLFASPVFSADFSLLIPSTKEQLSVLRWGQRTEEHFARDSTTLSTHQHQWWLHKATFSRLESHSNTTGDAAAFSYAQEKPCRSPPESRSSIPSFRFAPLLQPLIQTARRRIRSPCLLLRVLSHLKPAYIDAQNKNEFLEGGAEFSASPDINVSHREKTKPALENAGIWSPNTVLNLWLVYLELKRVEHSKAGRQFFFSKHFTKIKCCLFVTSLNSCSFKQANKKGPVVPTQPSFTFKRLQEKALFPLLRVASFSLCCPRAPRALAHRDGKACWPLQPFEAVAFHFLLAGNRPGAYEAKPVFEEGVNQQAQHVNAVNQLPGVRLYGNVPKMRKNKL